MTTFTELTEGRVQALAPSVRQEARAGASSGGWHVTLHERCETLEADWRALEDRGCCTLFQSFDWCSVWYEVASRHRLAEPVIVTAAPVGDTTSRVILALCRVKRRGLSFLTFADLGVSEMKAGSARGYAYFDFTIGDEPYKRGLRRPAGAAL